MTKDNGKSAVYAGEHAVRGLLDLANGDGCSRQVTVGGVTLVLPVERKFASIESIQTYCDQVCEITGCAPVRIRARRGSRFAHCEPGGVIAIPDQRLGWAMREIVVLHEMAHHISSGSGHDAGFRQAFLDLVEQCMAPEVALALRLSWWQEGVAA